MPTSAWMRLDSRPRLSAWLVKGQTVRIGTFDNHTPKLGAEELFRKALENRIIAASPWRLVPSTSASRWVLQATLESYEVRPLGLTLGSSGNPGGAGKGTGKGKDQGNARRGRHGRVRRGRAATRPAR